MNIIDNLRLITNYPAFYKLDINKELLKKILNDKDFKIQYKKNKTQINTFLDKLSNYKYSNAHGECPKLSTEELNSHVNNLIEVIKNNSQELYIKYFDNEKIYFEDVEKINPNFFKYQEFFELGHLMYDFGFGISIFSEQRNYPKIEEILSKGYGDNFIKYINKFGDKMSIENINVEMFNEKSFPIIYENVDICNKPLLDFVSNFEMDKLVQIINSGYFEGFKYTMDNCKNAIPVFQNITFKLTDQYSMNFVKSMGNKHLDALYKNGHFYSAINSNKIFKMADANNYQLIKDLINIQPFFDFSIIKDEDIEKDILEINVPSLSKNNIILNKYFNVPRERINDLKLVFDALSDIKLDENFILNNKSMYDILSRIIYSSNEEELINISKKLDINKKDEYAELTERLEQDGNEILKAAFIEELKDTEKNAVLKVVKKSNNKGEESDIQICEFNGQPFTMLSHSINVECRDENRKYSQMLIENPNMWGKLESGSNYISTALISEKYQDTFGNAQLIFGFSNIPTSSLKIMSDADLGLILTASENSKFNHRALMYEASVNTIVTPQRLIESTINKNRNQVYKQWNEVVISRKNKETGQCLMPNYIICKDYTNGISINAATQLKIPIYLINTKCYKNNTVLDNSNQLNEEESNLVK